MRVRSTRREILDDPVPDIALLMDSFREVWGVNRYLGGMAVLRRHLRPWLTRGSLTLLDVAAGTGEVGRALQQWARRRGVQLQVALLDSHPQVLAIARERYSDTPGMVVVPGDARRLPFDAGQFDVAICNLALHHFPDAEAVEVLRELDRVSRLGWVVSDLERCLPAYAAARLLAAAVWRNPITRHDGPLSVIRAYRADEAEALVRRAGVSATVTRHFPWRLAICSTRP